MSNQQLKLRLNFITPDYISEEYSATFSCVDDLLEEADDLAFQTVGFPLENWEMVDFGEGNRLYFFYPNEDDRTSKYKMSILEGSE